MKPSLLYIAFGELIEVVERNSAVLPDEFISDFSKLVDKYIKVDEHRREYNNPYKKQSKETNERTSIETQTKIPLPSNLKKVVVSTKIDYSKKYTSSMIKKLLNIRKGSFKKLVASGIIYEVKNDLYEFNQKEIEGLS